jgi:hypothetical protein
VAETTEVSLCRHHVRACQDISLEQYPKKKCPRNGLKEVGVMSRTCEERIDTELKIELRNLQQLWEAYQKGDEEVEDLGSFPEYGLSFDYVPEGTFNYQKEAYFRYQLSWGGPSDEFRFFVNPDFSVHRIEYWFLDWFDGAHRVLTGPDEELLQDIFDWFKDVGSVQVEYEKTMED